MKLFLCFFSLILTLTGFGQIKIQNLEIPHTDTTEIIIRHHGYALSYNEKHEQANWVAYELTAEETIKSSERTNVFLPDPAVSTLTANNQDYLKSGYDRGHLAPAADMSWSALSMQESFYYSNMSPQLPAFNRGIWKKLETLTRNWAEINCSIYIVTGPVLKPGLKTIGENGVSVPEYFYKVILDYELPERKAIAFILPNEASQDSLQHFAVSIDSIEILTGLDFFPLLSDKEENYLERTVCIACWNWQIIKVSSVSENSILDGQALPSEEKEREKKSQPTKIIAVQCTGINKNGVRCKNKTTNESERCHLHPNI